MSDSKTEAREWPVEPIALTIDEAAHALKVSRRTVQDLLARGELDSCARLVGKKWRISPTRLKDWLQGGKGKYGDNLN